MPTRIARLGRERTIATLARRVYDIDGRADAEVMRRAEARLLAANPRLATPDGFSSGATIVVPPVRGLRRADDRVTEADASGEGLPAETAARLQTMQGRIDDAFRRSAEARKETLERVSDRQFVAEARRALPRSTEFISAARSRLQRQDEVEAEAAKRLQEGVAGAIEGVERLEALVRRRTGR